MGELITIELFGYPFTFQADSNIARAKEIAEYLAKEVSNLEKEISSKSSHVDQKAILILAALNITGKYFEYRQKHDDLLHQMALRSKDLLNQLDAGLELETRLGGVLIGNTPW